MSQRQYQAWHPGDVPEISVPLPLTGISPPSAWGLDARVWTSEAPHSLLQGDPQSPLCLLSFKTA